MHLIHLHQLWNHWQTDEEQFPNIAILLQIAATLPVSTSTPERTFSALKRLKTSL
jgi:hypothetical protein